MSRLAVAVGLGCLLVAAAARAQPRQALLIGSSSVGGAVGRTLQRQLRLRGIDLRRRARSASGFARPDYFDWEAELGRLGPYEPLEAVLVYAGGNDTQALRLRPGERRYDEARRDWIRWSEEARWRELYANRVKAFVNELCARGARRVVLILPADGGREGWSERIGRVRAAQAAGARGSRCGAAVDPGWRVFASYDGVHLTGSGAQRLWVRVGEELLGLIRAR